jgi:hypothetical protein
MGFTRRAPEFSKPWGDGAIEVLGVDPLGELYPVAGSFPNKLVASDDAAFGVGGRGLPGGGRWVTLYRVVPI